MQVKPQGYDQTTRLKKVVKSGIIGLRKIRPQDVVKENKCSVSGSGDKATSKKVKQQPAGD